MAHSHVSHEVQVKLQVADALQQPFTDASFDLVWSMESGEHMPNKDKVSTLAPLPLFPTPFPHTPWLTRK